MRLHLKSENEDPGPWTAVVRWRSVGSIRAKSTVVQETFLGRRPVARIPPHFAAALQKAPACSRLPAPAGRLSTGCAPQRHRPRAPRGITAPQGPEEVLVPGRVWARWEPGAGCAGCGRLALLLCWGSHVGRGGGSG